ncbi:X-ray radiation resistance-associated protein 1 [Microcaecilia unicolor]|uniref:X-ray radiation resistance-associated protein 1 n=1 Tax=Microcaecilia unicolor TaxID=1415580 RepID=A0A6P7XS02_9AMPH|nr:X-ray radiation resistance-associated protein 1 [Microcaecilia unicolor]
MTTTWLQVNDTGTFPDNCFPVRNLFRPRGEGAGHWKVAHRALQQQRLNAMICSKGGEQFNLSKSPEEKQRDQTSREDIFEELEIKGNTLDFFFLMKTTSVNNPSDLCYVDLRDKNLTSAKDEDFKLFDCVVYISAAENRLALERFRAFSALRELDLSMNRIRNIMISKEDFPHLEFLDLSYNYLTKEDFLSLSVLPRLRVLYLTGNGLDSLSSEMAFSEPKFPSLEILKLDDNKLTHPSVFVVLANLINLRQLYLDQNGLSEVPYLKRASSPFHRPISNSINPIGDELHHAPDFSEGELTTDQQSAFSSSYKLVSDNVSPNEDGFQYSPDCSVEEQASEQQSVFSSYRPVSYNINPNEDEFQYFPNCSGEDLATEQQPSDEDVPDGDTMSQEDGIDDMEPPKKECPGKKVDFTFPPDPVLDNPFLKQPCVDKHFSFLKLITDSRVSLMQLNPATEPPFPKLRFLSLADNKVTNEESLIAVAIFPVLSELVIHGNPLVTLKSGDPPLLTSFLQDQLRIKLIRRKSLEKERLHIAIPVKAHRKVETYIPKVPKRPLMLEAPQHCYQDFLSGRSKLIGFGKESQLLAGHFSPVISVWKQQREETSENIQVSNSHHKARDKKTQDFLLDPVAEEGNVESVFMTQVGDLPDVPCKPQRKKSKKLKKQSKEEMIPEKYRGYEELLDAKVDPDFTEPEGILGNVRALEQALKHLCVYRDPKAKLHCIQKPYIPKEKKLRLPAAPPRKSKAEVLDEILTNMKNAQHFTDIPLAPLLKKKKAPRKEHGEALTLLKEVQVEYTKILEHSVKRAKELRMLSLDLPLTAMDLSC